MSASSASLGFHRCSASRPSIQAASCSLPAFPGKRIDLAANLIFLKGTTSVPASGPSSNAAWPPSALVSPPCAPSSTVSSAGVGPTLQPRTKCRARTDRREASNWAAVSHTDQASARITRLGPRETLCRSRANRTITSIWKRWMDRCRLAGNGCRAKVSQSRQTSTRGAKVIRSRRPHRRPYLVLLLAV